MNILRTLSLGCAVFASQVCFADYNGGSLENFDGTHTGEITISNTSGKAAVSTECIWDPSHINDYDKMTSLEGNITIDATNNHGIHMDSHNPGLYDVYRWNIALKTSKATDAIVINAYSDSGSNYAIYMQTGYSLPYGSDYGITLDASNSEEGITINQYGAKAAIYGLGKIDVFGKITINTAGGDGIYVWGEGGSGFQNQVTIDGFATISTPAIGINARNHVVTLKKGAKISAGSSSSSYSGAIYVADGGEVHGYEGRYEIKGNITAEWVSNPAIVDIVFGKDEVGSSSFVGKTFIRRMTDSFLNSDYIYLTFKDGSFWTVTEDSILTTLAVDGSSWLNFINADGGKLTTSIYALSVALAKGAILNIDVDGSTVVEGDEFTLFTGLSKGFDNLDEDSNYAALLYSSDGKWAFDYTNPVAGVFKITGIHYLIPEPVSASMALFGFAGLFMRRRR